jgi:hypothetical protein
LLVMGLALAGLPTLLGLAVVSYFDLTGHVLPGVMVGGVPVQGLTADQAAAELDRVWNQELRVTAVDVSDPSRVWLVTPAEFGLRVNSDQSAALAFAVGRGGGAADELLSIWRGLARPQNIAPVIEFDPLAALAAYQEWSARLAVPAVDAGLSLADGEVRVAPSAAGRRLDVLASLEWLAADPSAVMVQDGLIPLVTRPVPPVIPDVQAQLAEVEHLLMARPSLRAYDPVTDQWFDWSPDQATIASWIEVSAGSDALSVGLNEPLMLEYLAVQAEGLGPGRFIDLDQAWQSLHAGLKGAPSDTLIVRYRPRQHIVRAGETVNSISLTMGIPYWKWLPLNPLVQARGLAVGEALTMPPRDAMLELPVIPDKRIVVSLSEQHLWMYQGGELLADHVVSTGIPNSPTMPGIFQVKSHYLEAYASIWDLYMPHFVGIYDATPNLENGFHGLPLLSNGVRLWSSVLGRPVSYGCIVLDLQAAEHLYSWAEQGVVVEIRR